MYILKLISKKNNFYKKVFEYFVKKVFLTTFEVYF